MNCAHFSLAHIDLKNHHTDRIGFNKLSSLLSELILLISQNK